MSAATATTPTNTNEYLPTGGLVEIAKVTLASITEAMSAALISGSANGKRIREIRVFSGPGTDVLPGTLLLLKLSNGTSDVTLATAQCAGGADAQQAFWTFTNFFLPVGYSLHAQTRVALPGDGDLDWSFMGEVF